MAYATLEQMIERFGLEEMSQLLVDEQDLLTGELLQAALNDSVSSYSDQEQSAATYAINRADTIVDQQSDVMNTKLGTRYLLPLNRPDNGSIIECCLALSRAALSDDSSNISKLIMAERDNARKWLRDISESKAHLPDERSHKSGGAEKKYHTRQPRSSVNWEFY